MARSRMRADPFTDLLFNALLVFSFLFMISLLLVNPVSKLGSANLKAEYIITLSWPPERPADIDIWMQDPQGERVSYLQKDAGWLHLDRDDRGDLNDTVVINGEEIVHPINQEIVTIRGILAGEYIINLHYYQSDKPQPLPLTLKVEKVNPQLELVFIDQYELQRQDEELTAVRFRLDADGRFLGVNRIPATLTPYALDPS